MRIKKKPIIINLLAGLLIVGLFQQLYGQFSLANQPIADQLKRWLTFKTYTNVLRVGGVKLKTSSVIRDMYEARNYQPLWSNHFKIKPQVNQLIEVIKSVELEGLNPFDYHLLKIVVLIKEVAEEKKEHLRRLKIAALDLLLSDAFFTMAADLAYGRISPQLDIRAAYNFDENYDLVAILEEAVNEKRLQDVVARLRPPHEGFEKMREYLDHYRKVFKNEEWPLLINRKPMKKGMANQVGVKALRIKLKLLGDLEDEKGQVDLFDDKVEAALKQYQRRHGLHATGILDEKTKALLNTPLNIFIKKMEINMERWRWLPRDLGKEYILVNIPDFTVKVIKNKKVILTMNVVVGQDYTKTPIFSDELKYIVINPDWILPPNIIMRSELRKIRYQKDYFTKRNIRVVRGWGENQEQLVPEEIDWKKVRIKSIYEEYRFVQAPGPKNPLGKIKFMFPNEYNVYLHDTNRPELFEKEKRSYSSGCIRLSEPIKLAAYCLKRQSFWTTKRLEALMSHNIQKKIRLTKPIPIHMLYWTAWVSDDGKLQFRYDIYNRDKDIEKAFFKVNSPAIKNNPLLNKKVK